MKDRRFLLAAVLCLAVVSAEAQEEITVCGTHLTGDGYLSADLDCTGYTSSVIRADDRTKIDLRGYTLTTDCERAINVHTHKSKLTLFSTGGVGRIQGPGNCPDTSSAQGVAANRMVIRDVDIDGYSFGIVTNRIKATNVNITNNDRAGLYIDNKAVLRNVTIASSGEYGIFGQGDTVASLRESSVVGNAYDGIATTHVKCRDSDISGNAWSGIAATTRIRLAGTTVTANGLAGVELIHDSKPRTAVLKDSSIDGNSLDPGCTAFTCADLVLQRAPKLVGTSSCGTSLNADTVLRWESVSSTSCRVGSLGF